MSKERSRSKISRLPIIHPFVAGIDTGLRFHVAAVSPDFCDAPVQIFWALTGDLERMANRLVATGAKMVVMGSICVYWVAANEVLEWNDLEVILAIAARRVPFHAGRATSTTATEPPRLSWRPVYVSQAGMA